MNFIDLKALMGGARQCGVVVFAAGIVHGFTMPESTAVAVAMTLAGVVVLFVGSIKLRRKS